MIAAPKVPSGIPVSKSSAAVVSGATGATNSNGKAEASSTAPRISMVIQSIPPFKGSKPKQSASGDAKTTPVPASPPVPPLSPTSAQRLNVNASSFRPNPKAVAFTPVAPVPLTGVPKAEGATRPPNGSSSSATSASATASPKVKAVAVEHVRFFLHLLIHA